MIRLFYDVSEGRTTSKLREFIGDLGMPVNGLEKLTGADFLISNSHATMPTSLTDSIVHESLLHDHTDNGILIQRKSGADMVQSIPKLHEVLVRMRRWSPRCYLVYTGLYTLLDNDIIVIDGEQTNWRWQSFMGALAKWSFRGGYLSPVSLADDSYFANYLQMLAGWLDDEKNNPDLPPIPGRDIVLNDDQYPIRQMLVGLPGIDSVLSYRIAEWLGDSPGHFVLTLLTDYDTLKMDGKPVGLGRKKIENIREYFGITDDIESIGPYFKADFEN